MFGKSPDGGLCGATINGVVVLFIEVGFWQATKDRYPDLEALLKATSWRIKDRNGHFAVSPQELGSRSGPILNRAKAEIDALLKSKSAFMKGKLTVWVDGSEWKFINWTDAEAAPGPNKLFVKPANTLVLQIILALVLQRILHRPLCTTKKPN